MSITTINPYLVARMYAIHAAYADPKFGALGGFSRMVQENIQHPNAAKHWREALQEDEDGDGQGGGRGTIKGLRGKDAEHAKQAMRKLTRARR